MSTFTPGPWYAGKPTAIHGQVSIASEVKGNTIAICGWNSDEENVANGNLVAAAPAMYNFLVDLADLGDEKAERLIYEINNP